MCAHTKNQMCAHTFHQSVCYQVWRPSVRICLHASKVCKSRSMGCRWACLICDTWRSSCVCMSCAYDTCIASNPAWSENVEAGLLGEDGPSGLLCTCTCWGDSSRLAPFGLILQVLLLPFGEVGGVRLEISSLRLTSLFMLSCCSRRIRSVSMRSCKASCSCSRLSSASSSSPICSCHRLRSSGASSCAT
jgi:hypothetical protein